MPLWSTLAATAATARLLAAGLLVLLSPLVLPAARRAFHVVNWCLYWFVPICAVEGLERLACSSGGQGHLASALCEYMRVVRKEKSQIGLYITHSWWFDLLLVLWIWLIAALISH